MSNGHEENVYAGDIEKERAEFKKLLIDNPNYFGTFPALASKPVFPMKHNAKYEELRCVGFYPETNLIEAIIDVKLPYGYRGNLCATGSFEYVRFFIDWNGDGDFKDPDEDVGIASVNVHDIPGEPKACLKTVQPLSYAVSVKVQPKGQPCTKPYMVKVRAILSWDLPPTPGNPNFSPVWGNVIERWIQIRPAPILLRDVLTPGIMKEMKINPDILNLELGVSHEKSLAVEELKKAYKGKDVPPHRFNVAEITNIAHSIKLDPTILSKYLVEPKYKDMIESIKTVLQDKPNTQFEELDCLGLQYDQDSFAATLTVKKQVGYGGGLCTKGSREYVAFWAYVWDQIEQMCYWKYMGTAEVNVHDIPTIPAEGLRYAVYHPVDLSGLRRPCSQPMIVRVRAILSWATPPPTNNHDYRPVWGNIIETQVQIKPGASFQPGEQKPFIWAAGEMAVESIAGNVYSILPSALGTGYANGPSVNGGFTALESPFGGTIMISGTITNAPNNPLEIEKLLYKVQYRKVGLSWHDIEDSFRIWIRIDGVPSGHIDQVAAAGYLKFQKDLDLPKRVEVQDDVLTIWHTPVADGDGLYEIRVLLYKPGAAPQPGVPADHVASNSIYLVLDNLLPEAKITLDAGPCTKFTVGDTFSGKFTANDKHIRNYTISVLPPVASPPTVDMPGETYPDPDLPRINAPFKVTTTASTTPCGYVVYLEVWDRAIVNNTMPVHKSVSSVGLCLLEKKP